MQCCGFRPKQTVAVKPTKQHSKHKEINETLQTISVLEPSIGDELESFVAAALASCLSGCLQHRSEYYQSFSADGNQPTPVGHLLLQVQSGKCSFFFVLC